MNTSYDQDKKSYTGSCLCGAVRYKVKGNLRDVVNCHCSLCRKFHGHFGAYTAAKREDVIISDKEKQLAWYQTPGNKARRGFCARCGSSLFWELNGSAKLSIAAGTLNPPTGLHTTTNIYAADSGDYYELDQHLAQFKREL